MQKDQAGGGSRLSRQEAPGLIERIAQGDRDALQMLYDGTSRLLFGLVLRVLQDRASAEEALLDAYTYIWIHSPQYDPGTAPLGWLTATARAVAVSKLHADKRGKEKRAFDAADKDAPATVDPEMQRLARTSMESLSPAQREILNQAYYSGLSCSEIAAQTGRPLGAVKTHARLGLNKLGELLNSNTQQPNAAGDA